MERNFFPMKTKAEILFSTKIGFFFGDWFSEYNNTVNDILRFDLFLPIFMLDRIFGLKINFFSEN